MYLRDGRKEDCVGCRACAEICPQNCIVMVADDEEFLYPFVDKQTCTHCNLCEKTCPKNYFLTTKPDEQVWVGTYNSPEVIYQSSSGGAFTAIYGKMLELGYIVCGVKYDLHLNVVHDFADTVELCEEFRKSKYILSNTNVCFDKIATFLQGEHRVLFTGTPCQSAALYAFLGAKRVDTSSLIVVDLICHGAPNQKIFDSHLIELEQMERSAVSQFEFRFKSANCGIMNSRSAKIGFASGRSRTVDVGTDAFLEGYYSRLFYRPSCGECDFAKPERVSDLTIGDAWGIEDVYPEWNSLEGVSLILANTEKGKSLLNHLHEKMTLRRVPLDWAVKNNAQLAKPTKMHKNRDRFFANWKSRGFHKAVEKATHNSLFHRIIGKARWILLKSEGV